MNFIFYFSKNEKKKKKKNNLKIGQTNSRWVRVCESDRQRERTKKESIYMDCAVDVLNECPSDTEFTMNVFFLLLSIHEIMDSSYLIWKLSLWFPFKSQLRLFEPLLSSSKAMPYFTSKIINIFRCMRLFVHSFISTPPNSSYSEKHKRKKITISIVTCEWMWEILTEREAANQKKIIHLIYNSHRFFHFVSVSWRAHDFLYGIYYYITWHWHRGDKKVQ